MIIILFYFYSEIQVNLLNSGKILLNSGESFLNSGESCLNSGESVLKSGKKKFTWIQAKKLSPENTWIFFVFSYNRHFPFFLLKNPIVRHFQEKIAWIQDVSGQTSWIQANSGECRRKCPETIIFAQAISGHKKKIQAFSGKSVFAWIQAKTLLPQFRRSVLNSGEFAWIQDTFAWLQAKVS